MVARRHRNPMPYLSKRAHGLTADARRFSSEARVLADDRGHRDCRRSVRSTRPGICARPQSQPERRRQRAEDVRRACGGRSTGREAGRFKRLRDTPATGLARWRTRPHLLSDLQRMRGSRNTGANECRTGIRRSLKPRRRRYRQQISPNPRIAPSPQPAAHSCATGLRTMPAATRRALPPEPCNRAKLQNPWGWPFAIR